MAVAFVQNVGYLNSTGSTSTTTIVIPVTVTTTVGNAVIAWCRQQKGASRAISSVADSKSNTWHIDADHAGDADGPAALVSSVLTTALVSGDTITITLSATAAYRSAGAAEFSGLAVSAGVAVIDLNGWTTSTLVSVTETTGTSAAAGELVVTYAGAGNGQLTLTLADSSSLGTWTAETIPSSSYLGAGYEIGGTSASAYSAAWTSTTAGCGAGIVSYEPAVSGVIHVATGVGTYAFVGSASALHAAVCAGTYAFSGSAPALHAATGVGAYAFVGSASAIVVHKATCTGTYSVSGVASALHAATGTGTYSVSGVASAIVIYKATGTGTYAFAGTASASHVHTSTGASSYVFTGIASATIIHAATGAGTYAFSGVASALHAAAGAGVYSFSGTASASVVVQVSMTAEFIFHGALGAAPIASSMRIWEEMEKIGRPSIYTGTRRMIPKRR